MDNFYHNCPPKMSDGRFMTDYRPHTVVEEQIKRANGIIRDDDVRLFLQGNAGRICDREWDYLRNTQSCHSGECVHKYPLMMQPPWFEQELKDFNTSMVIGHTPFTCPPYSDYRMMAPSK